jgi:hypothetical protein
MKLRSLALTLGLLSVLMLGAIRTINAQTPTPSPTAATETPTTTPTFVPVNMEVTEAGVTWEPVPGAQMYEITVDALLYNVSMDNFCGPVADRKPVEVNLTQSLPASTTHLAFQLPPLPPGEEWFLKDANVKFTAFDSNGSPIAGIGRGYIAEGCMLQATPVPTVRPALPATGHGDEAERVVTTAVLALAVGAVTVLTCSWLLVHRRP